MTTAGPEKSEMSPLDIYRKSLDWMEIPEALEFFELKIERFPVDNTKREILMISDLNHATIPLVLVKSEIDEGTTIYDLAVSSSFMETGNEERMLAMAVVMRNSPVTPNLIFSSDEVRQYENYIIDSLEDLYQVNQSSRIYTDALRTYFEGNHTLYRTKEIADRTALDKYKV